MFWVRIGSYPTQYLGPQGQWTYGVNWEGKPLGPQGAPTCQWRLLRSDSEIRTDSESASFAEDATLKLIVGIICPLTYGPLKTCCMGLRILILCLLLKPQEPGQKHPTIGGSWGTPCCFASSGQRRDFPLLASGFHGFFLSRPLPMQEIACSVGDQWAIVHVWALELAPCGVLVRSQGPYRQLKDGAGWITGGLCSGWALGRFVLFPRKTSVLPSHKRADLPEAPSSRLYYRTEWTVLKAAACLFQYVP